MIELPEALTLSRQLNEAVAGKRVARVLPPTKLHKFCWFAGDPVLYEDKLKARTLTGVRTFGFFVELCFDAEVYINLNDGINCRFLPTLDKLPKDYQLLIVFDDDSALVFTVAMYGGIVLHSGDCENEYYLKSLSAVSPFAPEFASCFAQRLTEAKPSLSAKAFLATEQRFPGIGNGVSQDILFTAGINPKRKVVTMNEDDRARLLACMVERLREMTDRGGRNTEKDIYGNPGGYATLMSKNTLEFGCPHCGGAITKEAYLGGSVYYCPVCQPLVK